MSNESRRFARVYFDDLAKDHPEVWRDPDLLATWLWLLTACEKSWPSMAELPRSARPRIVARLVDLGMLTLAADHHFELRGFHTDRSKRQDTARNAAAKRWHSERNADAMPYTERDQKEKKPNQPTARASDPADAYWQLTGRFPTEKTLAWVDDLSSKFGGEAVIRAIVKAYTEDRSTSTLLGRAQDHLRAEARELDRKEREDEKRRLAEKRAIPRSIEPWREDLRQRLLEEAS